MEMEKELEIGHKIIGRRRLELSEDRYNDFVIVEVKKISRTRYRLTNDDYVYKKRTDEYYKNFAVENIFTLITMKSF